MEQPDVYFRVVHVSSYISRRISERWIEIDVRRYGLPSLGWILVLIFHHNELVCTLAVIRISRHISSVFGFPQARSSSSDSGLLFSIRKAGLKTVDDQKSLRFSRLLVPLNHGTEPSVIFFQCCGRNMRWQLLEFCRKASKKEQDTKTATKSNLIPICMLRLIRRAFFCLGRQQVALTSLVILKSGPASVSEIEWWNSIPRKYSFEQRRRLLTCD